MITYEQEALNIVVRLDNKIVGRIMKVAPNEKNGSGYYYRAKGGHCGVTFATVEHVKRSLQGDCS